MGRTTIDFGIDLGTTNSSVAVSKDLDAEVVKNNEGSEYTPSAVWQDKKGTFIVGRRAKERLEDEPENAYSEFKLQMGMTTRYRFARTGDQRTPVELSAEVLKALKKDVRQRFDEEMAAAVITVPAAFQLPQNDATKQAAALAGLDPVSLLQEPVAAAMAYGFQKEMNRSYWLVFDFGGGTFDAAVMNVHDGQMQVVNHGGDNHLGGKDIDWKIVGELLIPHAKREFQLEGLTRGNPKCRGAIAKLKQKAEEAKIRLSRDTSVEVIIDYLCNDDAGAPVRFEYELKRSDIEALIRPFVFRSVAICRKVLAEKRLQSSHIDRVLLVGGPTLTPILREILLDPKEGLGIPLEFSVDPLTVVARGAAIFAGTQRMAVTKSSQPKAGADSWGLEIEYKTTGPEVQFEIGGRILAPPGTSLKGYTIEFSDGSHWRSGPVRVTPEGVFMTTLLAEKGRKVVFSIVVRDPQGAVRPVQPSAIPYTVGLTVTDIPLTHDIRIGLADGSTTVVIPKGAPLPAKSKRMSYQQVEAVSKGKKTQGIRLSIVEGPYRKSGLNTLVGFIEKTGEDLSRDLRAGEEIEVRVEIDRSRLLTANLFVPVTDDEFPMTFDMGSYGQTSLEELKRKAAAVEDGIPKLKAQAAEFSLPGVVAILDEVVREDLLKEVRSSLAAAPSDPEAGKQCQGLVDGLLARIDEADQLVAWPAMVKETEDDIEWVRTEVAQRGTNDEKRRFPELEKETRRVMETKDLDALRFKDLEVWRLGFGILLRQESFLVGYFRDLEGKRDRMKDLGQADRSLNQGRRAIAAQDVDALRSAVLELRALVPPDDRYLFRLASTLRKG